MKFKSKAKAIYSPRLGRRIEFKRGTYSTDDPAEIAMLRRHPRVEEAPARKAKRPAHETADAVAEAAEAFEPWVVTVAENGEIVGEEPLEGQ